ncbi:hypothetical protein PMI07_000898 [Rhizobium sp. CF080]|uniref:hypothetical protein n=1 Tax=Rhizobium sp. (strain CF080) TaxID=1144310 RepID=UPI000271B4B7|nr:hypothetical protein [Rhizobium sp. CF080]EUB97322.1 hypothetical protein PMI07_000898 [Rhizobium sp. CF080]
MVSTILSFLSTFLVTLLTEWLADRRRDAEMKKAGSVEAASETQKQIAEAENVQHQNDLVERGGAADVAGRLRDHLRAGGNGA